MPYSWNQLELPFNLATKSGELYNQETLTPVSKMTVNFYSEEIENEGDEETDVEDAFKYPIE